MNSKNNTKISFLYRDAANYKFWHDAVVAGSVSQEQIDQIMGALEGDGGYFIPSAVGLPCDYASGYEPNDDDHPWCELFADSFEPTDHAPTVDMTAEALVQRFCDAKGRWEDLAPIEFSQAFVQPEASEPSDQTAPELRVVVVVEGGIVQAVYASDTRIGVEVIDTDTDDADECDSIDQALKALEQDVSSGSMTQTY